MALETRAALIVAVGLVLGGLVAGGLYSVTTGGASNPTGGTVYVVNRFTGSVHLCAANACRALHDEWAVVQQETTAK